MRADLAHRLRTLEITVAGRIEGILQGDHRGLLPGPGREAGDARPYSPGDDVRRIDWNVTARSLQPYVRDTEADHELETTLVIDTSGSMAFGTARGEKRDVALAVAAVYGFITGTGGNRVGAALVDEHVKWLPPRPGRDHVYRILGTIDAAPHRGSADLSRVLWTLVRARRRRGLMVIVSDFADPGVWDRPVRALVERHDVIGVRIVDPRERTFPDVGVIRVEDAETGRQRWLDTADRRFRRRFAAVAEAEADSVRQRMRRAGVDLLDLHTDRDWIGDIITSVLDRRRAQAAAGRTR